MPLISISCDGRDTPAALRDKLAAAEGGGAATAWLANHLFLRDPVAQAALALAHTRHMRVALMALSPLTLHPVQAAMTAATLDEAFPGRVTLCLGVGAPGDLEALGLAAKAPLRLMREALEVARALLAGETVSVDGDLLRARGRKLATGARTVPIVLAATGPRMLEIAGALADGVLITAGASTEFVARSLDQVQRGARGRRLTAHALVYGAVEDDEARAHARLRRTLAMILRGAHHAANIELAASGLDRAALSVAVEARDWARADALVTDDVVRRHAASGTPEQVRTRLEAYRAAGADEIVLAGTRDGSQIARILQAASGREA